MVSVLSTSMLTLGSFTLSGVSPADALEVSSIPLDPITTMNLPANIQGTLAQFSDAAGLVASLEVIRETRNAMKSSLRTEGSIPSIVKDTAVESKEALSTEKEIANSRTASDQEHEVETEVEEVVEKVDLGGGRGSSMQTKVREDDWEPFNTSLVDVVCATKPIVSCYYLALLCCIFRFWILF